MVYHTNTHGNRKLTTQIQFHLQLQISIEEEEAEAEKKQKIVTNSKHLHTNEGREKNYQIIKNA